MFTSSKKNIEIEVLQVKRARFFGWNQRQGHSLGTERNIRRSFQLAHKSLDDEFLNRDPLSTCHLFAFTGDGFGQFDCGSRSHLLSI